MKKSLFLAVAMLVSGSAFAATEHYLLRDGNHVYHLKITTLGDEISASTDVNFEPNSTEQGQAPCSAEVSGEAKKVGENELVLKRQIEGEARYCSVQIHLTPTGAKLEQSPDCSYYAAGICHFSSDGKELAKIK
jgi:hypothetical protein